EKRNSGKESQSKKAKYVQPATNEINYWTEYGNRSEPITDSSAAAKFMPSFSRTTEVRAFESMPGLDMEEETSLDFGRLGIKLTTYYHQVRFWKSQSDLVNYKFSPMEAKFKKLSDKARKMELSLEIE
ncbi:hypothetical protein MKW98_015525, partial [Papaver atlanticum]